MRTLPVRLLPFVLILLVPLFACQAGPTRMVVLDMERIASESAAAKAAFAEVQKLSEKVQDQLSGMAREIQAAEEAGRIRPGDLEAMKRQWIALRQEAESQVGARREAAAEEVEDVLRRAVEELASENGWDLALRKQDGVVWSKKDLDVTGSVARKMDEIWGRTHKGGHP
ncbi:MAG: OmpH family outer membrane protein [Acidobacteriota bacterium]